VTLPGQGTEPRPPATYASLLLAWARAGYVVAAPVFPLTNASAPGGANESDLVSPVATQIAPAASAQMPSGAL
jgi:hypothetical protein